MRRNTTLILSILIISAILRIWHLGNIPLGVSGEEVNFGLFLSRLGNFFLDPFLIRLPFAAIGVLSIWLFYLLTRKLFESEKIGLIGAILLSVMPWHVRESRVFSPGILIFTIFLLLVFLFFKKIKGNLNIVFKTVLVLATFFTAFGLLFPGQDITDKVNSKRLQISRVAPKNVSYAFVNKYVEHLRQKEKIFFENLDFGNYFFAGHPRERWGIEEGQKMFLFTLPLFLIGLLKLGSEKGKYLAVWTVISLSLIIFFEWRESQTLILIFPLVVLVAHGMSELLQKKNKSARLFMFSLLVFGVFEFLSYCNSYIHGYTETIFSPRRPVYISLISKIKEVKKIGDTVLVNDRLVDSEKYFYFYLNKNLTGFEFKYFKLQDLIETNTLYVDVLPDGSGPTEPLFRPDGLWPEKINVLAVFYDEGKKQKIILYKLR